MALRGSAASGGRGDGEERRQRRSEPARAAAHFASTGSSTSCRGRGKVREDREPRAARRSRRGPDRVQIRKIIAHVDLLCPCRLDAASLTVQSRRSTAAIASRGTLLRARPDGNCHDRTPPKSIPNRARRRRGSRGPFVLVGLMGAGKTSVGKRLATLLGVPFTDSDAEIARRRGCRSRRSSRPLGRAGVPRRRAAGDRAAAGRAAGGAGDRRRGLHRAADPGGDQRRGDLGVAARRPRALWDRVRDRPGRPLLQAADPRGGARRPDRAGARRSMPRPTSSSTAAAGPATRRWRARSSRRCAACDRGLAAGRRRWRRNDPETVAVPLGARAYDIRIGAGAARPGGRGDRAAAPPAAGGGA